MGLGLGLHAEELDGMVGRRALDRDQDDVPDAGSDGRVDQGGVAVAIDRLHAERVATTEPVDRRDEGRDAGHRSIHGRRVADIAGDELDSGDGRCRGGSGVPAEDPDRIAMCGQQRDQQTPERACSTCHEDHRDAAVPDAAAPLTIARTASPGPGPPSSTGSM